jgi:hypothetical protein
MSEVVWLPAGATANTAMTNANLPIPDIAVPFPSGHSL